MGHSLVYFGVTFAIGVSLTVALTLLGKLFKKLWEFDKAIFAPAVSIALGLLTAIIGLILIYFKL